MTDEPDIVEARAGRHSSLSIVIPAFNEESNIDRVYERLSKVLSELDLQWEMIFSVDPSTDRTEEAIVALRARDPRGPKLAGAASPRGDCGPP